MDGDRHVIQGFYLRKGPVLLLPEGLELRLAGLAAVPREDTAWEPPTVQAQPADFVCEGYEGQQDTWEHFGQWLYRLTEGRDRLTEKPIRNKNLLWMSS